MMLRYAMLSLRGRKGGFIGAFVALLCAAALVTACGVLLETGLRGAIVTERYAASPLIVTADQNAHRTTVRYKDDGTAKVKHKAKPLAERAWLPEDVVEKIAAVRGVAEAVPEVTFPARIMSSGPDAGGPAGNGQEGGRASYGHAWRSAALTPFRLVQGHAPTAAGDLVIDRELADRTRLRPGDRVTVQATQAPRTYRVTGVAAPSGAGLGHQTSLFFSTAEAARLSARPGLISAIGIRPGPGTGTETLRREVERALTGSTARVHAGEDRGTAEFPDAAKARTQLVSMGGAIGGTALSIAVLVVVGTFALSLQQRHRELALLRAIAATPRQIRRLISREALLLGGVAGTLGALAGLPLGTWLLGRFAGMGVIPATLRPAVSVFPVLAALAATLLGAWAAARVSARRISRIRPAEALDEAAVERPRLAPARVVAGILFLAAGAGLTVVVGALNTEAASTPVTYLAVIVLACAVALLGPLLVRATAALLAGPLRPARPGGRLAIANLRGNSGRVAGAVTPLTLLVGMACTVLFAQPTLAEAAQDQAREGTRADWVLAAEGPGVPAAAAEAVRRTPGVTAVTEIVRTTVRTADLEKLTAQGVTERGLARTWDPQVVQGSLASFGGNRVAVSRTAADSLGLRPGGELKLTLGDGTPTTVRVVAVYAKGLGFGDLTLPHDLLAQHVDNPLASTVLVTGGADRSRLETAIRAFPGVRLLAPGEAEVRQDGRQHAQAGVNYLAMGLIVAFTAIAAVNTLAISTSERAREFAMLRLTGATRRQVLRMLRLEALSVVLLAVVLGSGMSLAVLTAFSTGMTGTAAPAVLPPVYAMVIGAAGLLALAATALSGRMALIPRPVTVATAKQ
ncbi:FtsX-like permease family protein [Streptomyces sp. MST-110588]|uniref:FtsX-like permease family protein n=1 Tax=Streptomyces sp. MST-110588 TaxID=2833628 RepID=UPI001F5C7746|nr:FtsX-like permease family protein [Streptomyces sp. MST-110588]UNO39609.1 ABC transporter permease [Streptomyces sp. MST-110588]